MNARARLRSAVFASATLGLLLGGAALIHAAPRHAVPAITPAPVARPLTTARPPLGNSSRPSSCDVPARADQLVIDATCVDAPITDVGSGSAGVDIPGDVHQVGWWTASAPLTSPHGTSVLVGHVATRAQGSGALAALARTPLGATVRTTRGNVTSTWRLQSVIEVPKSHLPRWIYAGRSGPRRLVLVTCGGSIHRRHGRWTYDDNIVATAVPAV